MPTQPGCVLAIRTDILSNFVEFVQYVTFLARTEASMSVSEADEFVLSYIKLTHLGKFLNAFWKHVLVIMSDNFKRNDLGILVA